MSLDNQSLLHLTVTPTKKDELLPLIFDVQHSLKILRERYKEKKNTFDAHHIKRQGIDESKKLNKLIGQYKRNMKKGKDEYTKEVIEALF